MGDRTELLLVRHAESAWNAEGRWQGQGDPPLSARGRDQARGLARELAGDGVAGIVASPLRRARETAGILGGALGLEVELDRRLMEHDIGAWSGLVHAEIERRFPDQLARMQAGDLDLRVGGGESRRELLVRGLAGLHDVATRFAGKRVVVVTHGGLVRVVSAGERRLRNVECWRTDLATLRAGLGLA